MEPCESPMISPLDLDVVQRSTEINKGQTPRHIVYLKSAAVCLYACRSKIDYLNTLSSKVGQYFEVNYKLFIINIYILNYIYIYISRENILINIF